MSHTKDVGRTWADNTIIPHSNIKDSEDLKCWDTSNVKYTVIFYLLAHDRPTRQSSNITSSLCIQNRPFFWCKYVINVNLIMLCLGRRHGTKDSMTTNKDRSIPAFPAVARKDKNNKLGGEEHLCGNVQ